MTTEPVAAMALRSRPRLWTGEPYTIKTVIVDAAGAPDDPLGAVATVAFKTQCAECLELIGVWDRRIEPPVVPDADDVALAGVEYLRSMQFDVKVTGVICPRCRGLSETIPHHLEDGVPPGPTPGWIDW